MFIQIFLKQVNWFRNFNGTLARTHTHTRAHARTHAHTHTQYGDLLNLLAPKIKVG
jgi:hypothetical protein